MIAFIRVNTWVVLHIHPENILQSFFPDSKNC
jgi:hypothetical protein